MGSETGDEVPPADLVGPAAVVDVRFLSEEGKPGVSPFITSDHILAFEEDHGALKEGEVVLLQTGWARYYVEGEEGLKYMHGSLITMEAPGWPAPAPEMILYLHEKGVKTVGIDAPSIGSAHDPIPVHQEGLSRGMRYVEVLTTSESYRYAEPTSSFCRSRSPVPPAGPGERPRFCRDRLRGSAPADLLRF